MKVDVVTIGETMALFAAEQVGALANLSSMRIGIGGAESNLAIGLARLGTSVAWIGRVGNDPLGELVRREIRAEGVHVFDVIDETSATGLMVKEHRTANTSAVYYYRQASAGSNLTEDDLPINLIAGARLLHLTGITLAISESASRTALKAIEIALDHNVLVSFDINHRAKLWSNEEARRRLTAVLSSVDIVFAGDDEAGLITGGVDFTARQHAESLAALGPTQAIIKLGDRGSVAHIDGRYYEQPAFPVRPLDTVGAGDAFAAGYLSDLLAGAGAPTALRTASLAGAFACLSHGDWEGLPTRRNLSLLEPSAVAVSR